MRTILTSTYLPGLEIGHTKYPTGQFRRLLGPLASPSLLMLLTDPGLHGALDTIDRALEVGCVGYRLRVGMQRLLPSLCGIGQEVADEVELAALPGCSLEGRATAALMLSWSPEVTMSTPESPRFFSRPKRFDQVVAFSLLAISTESISLRPC